MLVGVVNVAVVVVLVGTLVVNVVIDVLVLVGVVNVAVVVVEVGTLVV